MPLKSLFLSLLMMLDLAGAATAGELASADQLVERVSRSHPRLYLKPGGFDTLRQRIEAEPLAGWFKQYRGQADRVLDDPPSKYEIPDGKRLLRVSRRVLDRTFNLALVYKLTGADKYRDRLWAELDAAAQFKDWNPSHFLDTAEMTHAFAVAYDWLHDDWTDAQRRTLREAMIRHGLTPGLHCYRGEKRYGWWVRSEHNWNQVCNGGLTLGALALAHDEPKIAGEILRSAIQSVPRAMKHFAPDGGWAEGVSYWNYATRYNVPMIACLQTAIGDDFDLADFEGFDQTGWFPVFMTGPTGTFDFADSHTRPVVRAPQLFWLATQYDQPGLAAYQRQHAKPHALDFVWYPENGAAKKLNDLPLDKHFDGIDFASMRSGWDRNAVCVGFKAGSNAVNHSHLDLGSFILDAHGERFAIDLGADDYNMPGYFGGKRWTYYRLRAEGHNTLVINPDKGPDQHPKAAAPITKFHSQAQRAYLITDLTEAYSPHVTRARRGVSLLDKRRKVVIQDEIECEQPIDLWWFLHTRAEIRIEDDGRSAVLDKNGKQIRLMISQPSGARFEVQPAEPLPSSPDPKMQADDEDVRKLTIHEPKFPGGRLVVIIQTHKPGGDQPTAQLAIPPLDQW